MRIPSILALVAALIALNAPAFGQGSPTVLKLAPENLSGETGTATIVPDGHGGIIVTVKMEYTQTDNQPAHIHTGQCGPTLGGVYKPLKNVVNGTSVTDIPNFSIADLNKGTYAINVHRSPTEGGNYVACTNIPKL